VTVNIDTASKFNVNMRTGIKEHASAYLNIDQEFVTIENVRPGDEVDTLTFDIVIFIPPAVTAAASAMLEGSATEEEALDAAKSVLLNNIRPTRFFEILDTFAELGVKKLAKILFGGKGDDIDPVFEGLVVAQYTASSSQPVTKGSLLKLRRLIESVTTGPLDCVCPDTRSTRRLGGADAPRKGGASKRQSAARQLLFGGVLDKPLCDPSLC